MLEQIQGLLVNSINLKNYTTLIDVTSISILKELEFYLMSFTLYNWNRLFIKPNLLEKSKIRKLLPSKSSPNDDLSIPTKKTPHSMTTNEHVNASNLGSTDQKEARNSPNTTKTNVSFKHHQDSPHSQHKLSSSSTNSTTKTNNSNSKHPSPSLRSSSPTILRNEASHKKINKTHRHQNRTEHLNKKLTKTKGGMINYDRNTKLHHTTSFPDITLTIAKIMLKQNFLNE
eukprot:TRINITY_DN2806_c0_g1_i3.p1 TRINITY_DN2806_c0_g1~~TRINITY_DN2806_c0_g1_i3.p1  ORF type:complete len:229 (-),score=38.88 TRINITY_DN2806_c0_g1_i3:95-781(-)